MWFDFAHQPGDEGDKGDKGELLNSLFLVSPLFLVSSSCPVWPIPNAHLS